MSEQIGPVSWEQNLSRHRAGGVNTQGYSTFMIDDADDRAVLQHLLAAINAHDADRTATLYTTAYVGLDVSRATHQHGPDAVRADWAAWFRAFPDLHVTFEEVVSQPGRVALYWTKKGTHQGPFLHVPPTGCCVEVSGVSLLVIEAGKIARALHLWDLAGMLRTMRLLPELPRSGRASDQAVRGARFLMCS